MSINDLKLASGKYLVANCGNFKSESNCQLIFMAPENQQNELVDTLHDHAIKIHKHNDTKELRNELIKHLKSITV